MARSFTMTRTQVVTTGPVELKAAIVSEAGSESVADSIMRSIERMGTDPSIEYFEMTEVPGSRRHGGTSPSAWRVRADRGVKEETEY